MLSRNKAIAALGLWAVVALAALAGQATARADVHRFEDSSGRVHLSDRAPRGLEPGVRATVVKPPRNTGVTRAVQARSVEVSCNPLTPWSGVIAEAAEAQGISPALVKATIRVESGFNPLAVSNKGALGLMQLMPETAARLGVGDAMRPEDNIKAGTAYLAQLLTAFGGDEALAVAAYNAGAGAVVQYGGVPPFAETQAFVERVLAFASCYGALP